ncbi:hypothetical protein RM572_07460 [Streptomyces sp. DSM 42041]|uniref:Uncharacterized protein n=1 Tax=Streptomyces hazeniae TaxID=3075538 RepID=A0ABU2NNR1_9ACTN|nr:hypothetical protein [Streptomyces sp. DSM 42041]MDT0378616.1 hypothetical protein [Streptomyces sp. DSM 42041]
MWVPVSVSGHLPGSARGHRGSAVHDHVALDEIELCCELMIAASTATTERLSAARIDEVLRVRRRAPGEGDARGDRVPAAHVPCQRRRG